MKTQIIILIFLMITCLSFAQTGSITNVTASQRTDGSMMVDIYYDLAGSQSKFRITAEASFDGGSNFAAINQLSGDIGYDVATGTAKHIIWNFGSEFPGSYSSTTQIRLTAGYNCGYVLIDERDGQSYNTVQIGDHCWMAENLNIDNVGSINRACYDGIVSNCDTYGGLYIWSDVNPVSPDYSQICPQGWYVPTVFEWCDMLYFLDNTVECSFPGSGNYSGTDIAAKLKNSTGWPTPGTNESGFSALPGGSLWWNSGIPHWSGIGTAASFWSSTPALPSDYVWGFEIDDGHSGIYLTVDTKQNLNSVRCIK
jgi:uncharacterized protein (TIGR02145 family)